MKINTFELKNIIKSLENTNNKYYLCNENNDIYIDALGKVWYSSLADKFYLIFSDQQIDMKNLDNTMSDLKELLEFIRVSYEELGTTIFYDPNNVDSLDYAFESYMEKLEKILDLYNSVDTSEMSGSEVSTLRRQEKGYYKELQTIRKVKKMVDKTIQTIEGYEKQIKKNISSIDVEKVSNERMVKGETQDTGETNLITDTAITINDNIISNTKKERECSSELERINDSVDKGYQTPNTESIRDLMKDLNEQVDVEIGNHEYDTTFITEHINDMIQIQQKNMSVMSSNLEMEDKITNVAGRK